MSEETKKIKRPARRRSVASKGASDASSPPPEGPGSLGAACGHDGCGLACSVRYIGPTSSMRDHHALHAARGVTHVWAAAIVTSLAVVVTGAVAMSSVEAKASAESLRLRQQAPGQSDWARVTERLAQVERALSEVKQVCGDRAQQETTSTSALLKDRESGKSITERKDSLKIKAPATTATPSSSTTEGTVTP